MRTHPNSGAGRIKYDASDRERLVDTKLAAKTFTLTAKALLDLRTEAARQGKTPIVIIEFQNGVRAEVVVS